MTTYAQFLESKQRRVAPAGIVPGDVHPGLFPHQAHLVRWACERGRAALFADTGLGKTRMQVEWARQLGARTLILAPLAVTRQTIREAEAIDVEVVYARNESEVSPAGITITNYERLDRFDPSDFSAVVLDESSILKAVSGKTKQAILDAFRRTPYRLACTATPAPNDEQELCNHAEFIGAASRAEMLSAYFVHDDEGWRLKGHAAEPMYRWMSSWAAAIRRPSDIGYPDDGYDLPELNIVPQVVHATIESGEQLFATDLGGVGGRARVRRQTLDARVERAVELALGDKEQWIIWCGLNDEARGVAREVEASVNVEGNQSAEEKAEAIWAFQQGDVRVLITKPSIAGYGLNLQNCSRMAFVGLSDSYESYYQAVRRCWRYGQTRPVEAHVVVSEIEQQIVANVRAKELQAARTTDALVRYMNREGTAA